VRVALIGARGQLGRDLAAALWHVGIEVLSLTHADVEITDLESVRRVLAAADLGPADRVANCAAHNLVDRAEEEPEIAHRANALGPRNVALVCAERNVPLLHVGSDHVFGLDRDRRTPYAETDPPGPLSAYGVSKLAGEQFVRAIQPRSFVVRTCGLYGHAATRAKGNFVETMLRLGGECQRGERERLTIVDDQTCTPTATADLAAALVKLLETDAFGLYHATNAGETTWHEFARTVFDLAGLAVETVPITTAQFAARAQRPAYSVLAGIKLAAVIGNPLPHWRNALERYLEHQATLLQ
jgi:dTDP-4-dehydrorhamnose reductase